MNQLDQFQFRILRVSKYNEMSFVIKLLLTRSLSQVDIEQDFIN